MGWIQDHRRQTSQTTHPQTDPESQFAAAARARWQELGKELRADVEEFNKQGSGAELASEGEDQYRAREYRLHGGLIKGLTGFATFAV